ncbi:S-adenosyl-L-methionine-dependent methyltransferase [Earliella scabrosa]|nr:S-adenosyl-L-methionine-dependent methyltransferase [Earliella scabrosa]
MTWVRNRQLLDALKVYVSPTSCFPRQQWGRAAWRRVANSSGQCTEVERILHDSIKATGPISFATYMQMCLSHPTAGYYTNAANAVFGSRGDFITSPEISQVFGELLGVWMLSQWMYAGASRKIRLVELGPGRGTLMHDVLRVFSKFPAARSATKEIHLVEISQPMREAQESKLGPIARANGWSLDWHDTVEGVSHDAHKFTLVLAHEFFDALPFHLLQKTILGWQEVLITSGPDPAAPTTLNTAANPSLVSSVSRISGVASGFRRVLSPTPTPMSTLLGMSSTRFKNIPVDSYIEVSPSGFKIARRIGELLYDGDSNGARSAGSALIVDYGGDKVYGNSFRAFKNHKIVDVFHRPGECDLTVNVDFAYLREAVANLAAHHGPVSQATFLNRMGLRARVNALKAGAKTDERKQQIEAAANRLVDTSGMGSQYQVMALTGKRAASLSAEERWPFVDV